ncbi:hypothetical protein PG995_015862 [Apiospora arundinis]
MLVVASETLEPSNPSSPQALLPKVFERRGRSERELQSAYPQFGQNDGSKVLDRLRMAPHRDGSMGALDFGVDRVDGRRQFGGILVNHFLQPFRAVLDNRLATVRVHRRRIQHLQTGRLDLSALPLASHQRPQAAQEAFAQEHLGGDIRCNGKDGSGHTKGDDVVVVSGPLHTSKEEMRQGLGAFVSCGFEVRRRGQDGMTTDLFGLSHVQIAENAVKTVVVEDFAYGLVGFVLLASGVVVVKKLGEEVQSFAGVDVFLAALHETGEKELSLVQVAELGHFLLVGGDGDLCLLHDGRTGQFLSVSDGESMHEWLDEIDDRGRYDIKEKRK